MLPSPQWRFLHQLQHKPRHQPRHQPRNQPRHRHRHRHRQQRCRLACNTSCFLIRLLRCIGLHTMTATATHSRLSTPRAITSAHVTPIRLSINIQKHPRPAWLPSPWSALAHNLYANISTNRTVFGGQCPRREFWQSLFSSRGNRHKVLWRENAWANASPTFHM